MIIDHQYKYILASIPKTGSISIQFSLGYGHDIPEPALYHMSMVDIIEQNPKCSHYTKGGFVRNPWDRMVSLYHDFTVNRVYQYSGLVRVTKPLLSEFKDFEDFCLNIHQSSWMNDIFFKSQTHLLGYKEGLSDFIGRFEHLSEDFKRFCDLVGLKDISLECRNIGKYDKSSYRRFYSDRAAEAIGKLYRDDVEILDYEF